MICMIIFAVFGIIALIKGEFYLTRDRVVRAVPARIIGVILLLPFPLAFMVGAALGLFIELRGGNVNVNDKGFMGTAAVLELMIMGGCLLAAILIAALNAKPVRRKRRRRREDDEDEEEDRPRRRTRYEDEEDEPPPRRPRADNDEDRPRRRPDDRIRD
jgi:hypothetical protein